jgi:hypothetical protein
LVVNIDQKVLSIIKQTVGVDLMMGETVKLESILAVLLATIGVVFRKMLCVFLEIITSASPSEKRRKKFLPLTYSESTSVRNVPKKERRVRTNLRKRKKKEKNKKNLTLTFMSEFSSHFLKKNRKKTKKNFFSCVSIRTVPKKK